MKKTINLPGAALASVAALSVAMPSAVFARPRADTTTDPQELFAQLQTAVTEMRAKHDEKLDAKVDDTVLTEEIDRINSSISELQDSVDAAIRENQAGGLSGGGEPEVADPEYTQAFAEHFRSPESPTPKAALSRDPDIEGGYLAPTEWDRTITDKLIEVSPMRSIARVENTNKGAFKKLFNLRGTASGWVGEKAARPETTTPQFAELEYEAHELYAQPGLTQQIIDDAEIDIMSWLAGEVQTEFAQKEGAAFVAGDGVGKPTGFLAYVAGGVADGTHPLGNISTVNSGAANGLTSDGIVSLTNDLPTSFRTNARFTMSRPTEGLVRLLKDGQGNYLWQPSYQAGVPATLNGYPITELPDQPAVAAASMPIAFGDFREGYLIFDRKGVVVMMDPYTNKPYVLAYTTKRVGGGVLNPEALRIQVIAA